MSIDTNLDLDIGSLLLEKKVISQDQLNEANEQQKIKGGYLSQHLIDLGFIKDSDLAACFTCQYGFSYIALRSLDISESALNALPLKIICDYYVLPIERNDRLLTVAMADPLNKGVLEILRQTSHCEIVVVISSRSEIKEAIEKYFSIPFKNARLDTFANDIILRDNLSNLFITHGYDTILNRRRYKRLSTQLNGEYYFYPNIFRTRITNISMSGILFESKTAIPKGMQMAKKLYLDENTVVMAVIEVIRREPKNAMQGHFGNNRGITYDIGAFFNFMSIEDQYLFADFLKKRFYA